MPSLAPKIRLSNGQYIPILGLGTWRSNQTDAEQAIKDAIDIGYRHIDTSFVDGNELEVGTAIRCKINEGVIKREDIFVVAKLRGIHNQPKIVENACRQSLSNLGLDYIDLFLMHIPERYIAYSISDYLTTWRAMEQLVDQNIVRGLGFSNFNAGQMELILKDCRIKPLINHIKCHPGFNEKDLILYARERDIMTASFCPLSRSVPIMRWPNFLYGPEAQCLARKYKKTPAQVCLRYIIQLGVIPIPKSVSKKRIAENFNVFDFELCAEDMKIMEQFHDSVHVDIFKTGFIGIMTPPDG